MNGFSQAFTPAGWAIVLDVLVKLGIGAIIGGIIGWERELHGRPAGIRTHILIALGVILYTEISKGFVGSDPSRVAAQVVTGIGFLGAGTILRVGSEVRGLTSAASIWAVSAVAMAISLGGPFLFVGVVGGLLTLVTLNVIEKMERLLIPGMKVGDFAITLHDRTQLPAVLEALQTLGGRVSGLRIIRPNEPFEIEVTLSGNRMNILSAVSKVDGVSEAHWKD